MRKCPSKYKKKNPCLLMHKHSRARKIFGSILLIYKTASPGESIWDGPERSSRISGDECKQLLILWRVAMTKPHLDFPGIPWQLNAMFSHNRHFSWFKCVLPSAHVGNIVPSASFWETVSLSDEFLSIERINVYIIGMV